MENGKVVEARSWQAVGMCEFGGVGSIGASVGYHTVNTQVKELGSNGTERARWAQVVGRRSPRTRRRRATVA